MSGVEVGQRSPLEETIKIIWGQWLSITGRGQNMNVVKGTNERRGFAEEELKVVQEQEKKKKMEVSLRKT